MVAGLAAAATAAGISATIDLDGNGLADAWELLYRAEAVQPGDDDDGDGVTNLAESNAGTDPFSNDSYFRMADMRSSEDGIVLCWQTIAGKEYQLERTTDLENWVSEGVWRYGDGSLFSLPLCDDQKVFTAGSIRREIYNLTPSGGWGLNYLRNFPSYLANTPDTVESLTSLQFLQSTPNADWFGTRIRCYLIPPRTGEYTFHVASDDFSELHLSTNASPEHTSVIASVSGWTGAGEWDKYPSQHSDPVQLTQGHVYYLEFEHFEGGGGDHATIAWEGPGINFAPIPAEYLAPYMVENETFIDPNKHDYFRIKVRDRDTDNDGVADFEETVLGTNPESPSSTGGGLNDLAALQASLADNIRISVTALDTAAYEAEGQPGRFRVVREGNIEEVTVSFSLSGQASLLDFQPIGTSVQFPLGTREQIITIDPVLDGILEQDENLILTILPHSDYEISGSGAASLLIEDAQPVLHISRPAPGETVNSIATSRILYWERGNRTAAEITLEVTNLTSPQIDTALLVDPVGGGAAIEVATLPAGLLNSHFFDYATANGVTASELRSAIDEGRFRIVVRTNNYPSGELSAVLQPQAVDSNSFTPPAEAIAPPPAGSYPQNEVVRFLSQATFGPRAADLSAIHTLGYEGWIDQQLDPIQTPPSLHLPALQARADAELSVHQSHRQAEWFQHAVNGQDQLRQRVAFALSEIFVVSDNDGTLNNNPLGLTNYYDMLVQQAFGNYRTLIEDISLSPIMANYLSHLRNPKADPYLGTNPDENYAREIMQLFSIGLVQLHPDGTVKTGPDGVDLPTYNQDTITNMARVFTGWSYHTSDVANTSFWYGSRDMINPLTNFPGYHDTDEKTIVNGVVLPAEQTAEQDLADTLDALFNHPNTGPFLARRLIQRLVTSNPSPGYIYRVASAFNDDGTGTRGNLGAVVKAILLDQEARDSNLAYLPGYGKQHEPLIRMTRLLRLFGHTSPSTTFWLTYENNYFGQAPLRSPTVFNFFLADYALPGEIADAGLVSPEFQIVPETTIITATNRLVDLLDDNGMMHWDPPNHLDFDWQPYYDLYASGGTSALVDFLDLYLCNGFMSPAMRTEVTDMIDNTNHWDSNHTANYRVQAAVQVVATSPAAAIQR